MAEDAARGRARAGPLLPRATGRGHGRHAATSRARRRGQHRDGGERGQGRACQERRGFERRVPARRFGRGLRRLRRRRQLLRGLGGRARARQHDRLDKKGRGLRRHGQQRIRLRRGPAGPAQLSGARARLRLRFPSEERGRRPSDEERGRRFFDEDTAPASLNLHARRKTTGVVRRGWLFLLRRVLLLRRVQRTTPASGLEALA